MGLKRGNTRLRSHKSSPTLRSSARAEDFWRRLQDESSNVSKDNQLRELIQTSKTFFSTEPTSTVKFSTELDEENSRNFFKEPSIALTPHQTLNLSLRSNQTVTTVSTSPSTLRSTPPSTLRSTPSLSFRKKLSPAENKSQSHSFFSNHNDSSQNRQPELFSACGFRNRILTLLSASFLWNGKNSKALDIKSSVPVFVKDYENTETALDSPCLINAGKSFFSSLKSPGVKLNLISPIAPFFNRGRSSSNYKANCNSARSDKSTNQISIPSSPEDNFKIRSSEPNKVENFIASGFNETRSFALRKRSIKSKLSLHGLRKKCLDSERADECLEDELECEDVEDELAMLYSNAMIPLEFPVEMNFVATQSL
ncbi:hypothetical protein BY996DRAFT_6414506 [Phakopsora pachyrhizi]|uniref:Expressed protein n=1 Tax=Phakopsora pachyrhizi TaxID=170000 RepID=A0AAV0AGU2_PHAPC|nr:hypothetical protein BY996DRAFT_6414506 [Phakopsora pachyrhizi]CAH7666505.1 expressed protein [Phakopsora pachyrhizi]